MSHRPFIEEYLQCFAAADIDGIESLLAVDFTLTGPLANCGSRDDYVELLRRDPPEPGCCEIRSFIEQGSMALVLYSYEKPAGQPMRIAQWFELERGLIKTTLLAFELS